MKKIIPTIFTLIIIGICLWIAIWSKQATKIVTVEKLSPTTNVVALQITNRVVEKQETETKQPAGMDDKAWQAIQVMFQMVMQENKPVEFFVRILDQNEQPVSGAVLTCSMSHIDDKLTLHDFSMSSSSGTLLQEPLILVSGPDGWIRYKGRTGKYVDFISLSKEGFMAQIPLEFKKLNFSPGYRNNAQNEVVRDPSDFQKSITFHLWKKGETEQLIQSDRGYVIMRDKPEQIISLFPPLAGQITYPDLILKTPFAHPEILEGDRAYDRWIIIEAAPDAGIQETTMPYPYFAPQDGYERAFRVMYQLGFHEKEDWMRNFYVKARSGKVFASLTVTFSSQSGLTLQVKSIINPTGSRNLEPDPDKLITAPAEIRRIDEATRPK